MNPIIAEEEMIHNIVRLTWLLLVSLSVTTAVSAVDTYFVFVGTYTSGDAKGIYTCELDLATGSLKKIGVSTGVVNPSFLAIHPNGKFLYSVAEIGDFEGKKTGGVAAFSIDSKTASLTLLNQKSSGGPGACHISLDRTGKNALVANYGGGSVAALPIGDDGRLSSPSSVIKHTGSSVTQRQKAPRAHSINVGPNNRFAFAADLGIDKVLIYRLDVEKGLLTPNHPPFVKTALGAGPRHFTFHPSGKFAYVINELDLTVNALTFDAAQGSLKSIQTISTLPKGITDTKGFSTAEIVAHPGGKFLYGSNRGHDSIVVYQVDAKTGKLTFVETEPSGGKNPRNFAVDPSGKYLLAENQSTHSIVVLQIDPKTGALSPTGHELDIPSPVCVRFLAKSN